MQRVNFVTMETLSDGWPNHFSNLQRTPDVVDSLSAMQGNQHAETSLPLHLFLSQSSFVYACIHTGTNVGRGQLAYSL